MDLDSRVREKMQVFEMRCYRRLLTISYKNHITNEEGRRHSQDSRSSGLEKTISLGTMNGKRKEVGRRRDGKTILKSG